MEKPWLNVAWWLNRSVSVEGEDMVCWGGATVLAVDDTPHAPSAWVKFGVYPPRYRSIDLSELTDVETGEGGPRWGTGGMEADMRLRVASCTTSSAKPIDGL